MGTEWNIQPMWYEIGVWKWCLGRLWPSGVLRSASIQSTWLHTKDNTARSNGWICGSPRFDRLYRECVQPVLLLLLQRGPVMIRKPRPPAMIEEKHVKNTGTTTDHNELCSHSIVTIRTGAGTARTISATTTFPRTSTATKATCAFVDGFPWR